MTPSRDLAALIGPSLMAVTAAEGLNLSIFAAVDARATFLDGMVLFVAGLAVVRLHNLWTWRWPLLVTLLGWLMLGAGLTRMFLPAAPPPTGPALYDVIVPLFATGAFLSWKGWRGG